jgi:hypothetical protein
MALQISTFPWQQWDTTIMGTPIDMNTTMAQQYRNDVFCAVHAEML